MSWKDCPTTPIPEQTMRQMMGWEEGVISGPVDDRAPEDEDETPEVEPFDPEITIRACRKCMNALDDCTCPPRTF